MWNYTGKRRPSNAIIPRADQESVWDYPRPPRIELCTHEVLVMNGDTELAVSRAALRVLETASPPTIYIPTYDVNLKHLVEVPQQSFCEWKGIASYLALAENSGSPPVAWYYPEPKKAFKRLREHIAFYPGRVECYLGGEAVKPQRSEFYGGWITNDIVGPCKGDPGTENW